MAEIKVAFWNLQNLFDTTPNAIATDFEFTPAELWTQAAFNAKLQNLAEIIQLMHGGAGPDLLGVCEVESTGLARQLADAAGLANFGVAEVAPTDQRGINTSLIYSKDHFDLDPGALVRGHLVHVRYPTRDILEVPLIVKDNTATLRVLVNHWPSRRRGQYESEPLRIAVAEMCGRVVDETLKFTRDEIFAGGVPTLDQMKGRWNRNVLLMGDFNDEPHSRSIVDHLRASKDGDHLEEEIKDTGATVEEKRRNYLERKPYLFNCMWPQFGTPDHGSLFFSGSTNSANVLDQFIISRGLFYGLQNLKMRRESVTIFKAPAMTTAKGRVREFDKKEFAQNGKSGYSDHFPIQAVIDSV